MDEADRDGGLTRLLQELANANSLDLDDGVGEGEEDEDCELAPSIASSSLNLILVTNLNIRVVLCDCGRAYRIPDVEECSYRTTDEQNNNNITDIYNYATDSAVLAMPGGLKERY